MKMYKVTQPLQVIEVYHNGELIAYDLEESARISKKAYNQLMQCYTDNYTEVFTGTGSFINENEHCIACFSYRYHKCGNENRFSESEAVNFFQNAISNDLCDLVSY